MLFGTSLPDYKTVEVASPSRPLFKQVYQGNSSSSKQADIKPKTDNSSSSSSKPTDEKLAALMAYRKAKGLCYKCGGKWGPQHKCPTSVPLNMIEEVWQLMAEPMEASSHAPTVHSDSDDELMAISAPALGGTTSSKTFKLMAFIKQHQCVILVDSGSTHNFISEQLAASLSPWSALASPMSVKIADGATILCTHEILNCEWSVQGILFTTTFKILPLKCYDAILGIEWLENYSPMQVQWKRKWLCFSYQGTSVKLQGIQDTCQPSSEFSAQQLQALDKSDGIWCLVHLYTVDTISDSESNPVPKEIQTLVNQFDKIFAEPTGVPPTRAYTHSIPLLPGSQPFRLKPYRYTPFQKDEIEQQVTQLLKTNMIQESTSPFASPALLVKKKTGDWRLCVDYRKLNAFTVKNKFPLPVIEELFEELHGAQWFTTLDLRSGFHQIMVNIEDQYKTAFQTHHGHYEYKVMPYGLTGAPATFQAVMNHALAPLLRKCVVVFIDDILIYSATYEAHVQHVKQVFELLQFHQFKVKLSKCSFACKQLKYLGHIISSNGVATDPTKITIIQKWPSPTSVKELRSFLGLAGYYRRFVKNFGSIAKPLTELLKKGHLFVWTASTESAFQCLKQSLMTTPVLATPNFHQPFVVETDASDKGIGAVLQQNGHPIAFVSKALGPKTQGLSTYEKESLAILLAVDQWKAYLQPAEFVIQTDQRSLTYLSDQKLKTYWQQKAMTKLMGFQYKICYKKGSTNNAADALSRVTHATASLSAISVAQPLWLQELQLSYSHEPSAQKLLQSLTLTNPDGHFSLVSGLIKYKQALWLGHSQQFQSMVMEQLHASALGGHSGFLVTYHRIKKLFYWPNMKASIKIFVASCIVCQQAKAERVPYPGLLQPLHVPDQAWKTVTVDFIEGLPTSSSYNCILVVVDKFSKYAHFVKLKHPFSALQIAKQYMEHVYKLHGMPLAIVSDRDKIFTSLLWKELFKLSGTNLCMSSAYHPQSDGQTERVNQCIEGYLRCFIQSCANQWSHWLHLTEFWYNTCYHSSTQHTPFEILYGHAPRHFGIDPDQDCQTADLKLWLQERKTVTALVQQQLLRAQTRMKHQADKRRTERIFEVGDKVWLKLQPYAQSSLVSRINQKLSYRYFGPYEVESKIGSVAYKLKLPETATIHPVFHVSLLKKVTGNPEVSFSPIPVSDTITQEPELVLDRRVHIKARRAVTQLLIKWANLPPEMATWEDEDILFHKFPEFSAWGQAVAKEGGDVAVPERVQPKTNFIPRSERSKKPNQRYKGAEWSS